MSNWRELMGQKRFEEAVEQVEAEFAAGSDDGRHFLDRGWFYESWGDWVKNTNPDEGRRLYLRAMADYERFARRATGSGEGYEFMMEVNSVAEKLKALEQIR